MSDEVGDETATMCAGLHLKQMQAYDCCEIKYKAVILYDAIQINNSSFW